MADGNGCRGKRDFKGLRLRLALFLSLAALVLLFFPHHVKLPGDRESGGEDFGDLLDEIGPAEREAGRYYRLVDQEGRLLLITGRRLHKGDRYLASGNQLYEVVAVEGQIATARLKETVKLRDPGAFPSSSAALQSSPSSLGEALPASAFPLFPLGGERVRVRGGIFSLPAGLITPGNVDRAEAQAGQIAQQKRSFRIGIYHTHNAESYLPSDGTDSIYGRGGIHAVGAAFRDALQAKGITALYSERLHLPHDRGAYRRSRGTALELLRQNPDALFDVHRDAAPWEAYAAEVAGEPVSQIMIVVGLSHAGAAVNQNFAYDLKGYADRIHPGLIKGVLSSFGSYNQDLSPLNLLLEVGAHTNTRESAVRGITLFADVVGYYFYGPRYLGESAQRPDGEDQDALPPALYRDAGGVTGTISATVIGLLLASLGAALGFYFLNNPEALEKTQVWFEDLPRNLAFLARRSKEAAAGFPGWAASLPERFPANLKANLIGLREDAQNLPAVLSKKGKLAIELLKHWWRSLGALLRQAPALLRYGWFILRQEGRELPAYLAARGRQAAGLLARRRRSFSIVAREVRERLQRPWAAVRKGGGPVPGRPAAGQAYPSRGVRGGRRNLANGWTALRKEAAARLRFLAEKVNFLLRRRLR